MAHNPHNSHNPHNPHNPHNLKAAQFCMRCLLILIAVAAAIAGSFAYLSLDLGQLFSMDAAAGMLRFMLTFFPPELSSAFLAKTGAGMFETLAVSAVGTLCAAVLGFGLALPASGLYGDALRAFSRLLLNLLRSIPELVWAALTVLAVGLGPFAGTLALALHTAGVLGRLFAEALENAPRTPARALTEAGTPAALVFVYGTLPCVWPQFLAYILYRWENNIRVAAILGFVGAGGLGQMLYFELSLFHLSQACTVIIAMLALAAMVDTASAILRVDRHSR